MRKASKIILILGGVFGIVSALEILVKSFVLGFVGVLSSSGLIVPGAIIVNGGYNPEFYALIAGGIVYALIFMVAACVTACFAIIPLIASIIGFLGSKNKPFQGKKGIFTANLALGILVLVFVGSSIYGLVASIMLILGGVFGMSAVEEEKKQAEPEEDIA